MKTYYCDGSSSEKMNRIGIGIIGDNLLRYEEKKFTLYKPMSHEIEALISTVESLEGNCFGIRIVNDDKYLVQTIEKSKQGEKIRSKGLLKNPRYHTLVGMIKKYRIVVDTPNTKEDRNMLKRCHLLSREYMG